jgi:SAM-dependent methyltransferase
VHGYAEDLAYVHDAGFGAVAEAGAREVAALLSRRGRAHGLVVELGCGSGISSRLFADSGYDVLGIDSSPAMIELARARVPEATFRLASFVDAALPHCVAVTGFGEVLNYVFDPRIAPRTLDTLCRRVYAALEAGGLFVLDLAGPGRGSDRGWTIGEDWAVLFSAEEDARHRELTRRITAFRRTANGYRRSDEVHRQRLYPVDDAAELLRRTGFRVRVRRGYGDRPLASNVRAFLATKPKNPVHNDASSPGRDGRVRVKDAGSTRTA